MSFEPNAECAQSSGASHPHKERNYSQLKEGPLSTKTKRDAQQASASGPKTNRHIIHSAWFSKHTTRLPVHTSACLKHSNFLNTDRMRKRDHPTAVHIKRFSTSVFNKSDRDVPSSFRATQILRQGPPCTQPGGTPLSFRID